MNRDLDWSDVDADARRMTEEAALRNIDINALRIRQLEEEAIYNLISVDIGHYLAKQIDSGRLLDVLQRTRDSVEYCPFHDSAQKVVGHDTTPGADPTCVTELECGHKVI